jgi:FemAB-related protein (PEP-CTERM system-associated)
MTRTDPGTGGTPATIDAAEGTTTIGTERAREVHSLEIVLGGPAEDAERDRFVRAHPRGTFFHLAGWRRAVERAFGHAPRDLVARRGGELVGVLPLMRCRGPLGRAHLVSMPYAVYGGPLGIDAEVERALTAAAVALAEQERVGRLELRCREDLGLDLLPSDLYATFVQPLPDDPALVMKAMPKRARAEVRKAIEKHQLELGQGSWYLPDVVLLFGASKQHLGSPGLPARWFEALQQEFPDETFVHLARRGREVLAATMSFVFRDTFLFYYIGTTAEANREYKATHWLCTVLQEWSIARGLKQFDLGRSRRDSGSFAFKEHQGFEPAPLQYRYKLVQSRELPSFTPSNPRTKVLRDTWTKLPPWVARRLSDRLARFLP